MSHKIKDKFNDYEAPAGGWGALKSVARNWVASHKIVQNARAMLKTNQPAGFDCPGCAWGDNPHKGAFKFCENGAKAVNWESTASLVTPDFFAATTVTALLNQSDHELEKHGRLTHPLRYDAVLDTYVACAWDEAFALVAKHLKAQPSPDAVEFYTSGRASNEAAFLYQLFARAYGTNNLPDCSNMCHEASGVGMKETIGVGKGTVVIEDFDVADCVFIIGQNPGTNHPRMLETLREVVARGAKVICLNPLKERGLERFQNPQMKLEMLTNESEPTHTAYYHPHLGGDMAVMRGIAKWFLHWERAGQAVLDHDFIAQHTTGLDAYVALVDATEWAQIEAQSGLTRAEIGNMAAMHRDSQRVIMCWAMGVTQHRHSVQIVQEIVHVQLLRGQIGKPGCGLSPVRGHSNVQGDRTVGIYETPPAALLDALDRRFKFKSPRHDGHNTVLAIEAMERGDAKVFIGLGGNFAQATPDTARTHAALRQCDLTVHIATKLNRSHLVHGKDALILPCLGRSECDMQAQGQQGVTVEDTFSMVHISSGILQPASPHLKSEPAIIAGMAKATLGNRPIDWDWVIEDYGRIRDLIEDTIDGFADFNRRLLQPGGFHLGNAADERRWLTPSGKAQFQANPLPESLLQLTVPGSAAHPDLILQTLRSHDQYNTTVYSYNDRYRGIHGKRDIVLMNPNDIARLGLVQGEKVDVVSLWGDGRERRVCGFEVVPYDLPAGQCAAYYPETNPLVPLESFGDKTWTPTSKFIAVKFERCGAAVG